MNKDNYSEMLFNRDKRLIDKIKELEEKNKTFEDYNKDLNNQLDKLEEENKRLKEDYDILDKFDDKNINDYKKLEEENKKLKSKIDKAIKYIGSITDVKVRYFNYREFEKQGLHISNEELRKRVKEQKLEGQYIEIDRNDILKILKGEENESN